LDTLVKAATVTFHPAAPSSSSIARTVLLVVLGGFSGSCDTTVMCRSAANHASWLAPPDVKWSNVALLITACGFIDAMAVAAPASDSCTSLLPIGVSTVALSAKVAMNACSSARAAS
jgi:hypothetical protein